MSESSAGHIVCAHKGMAKTRKKDTGETPRAYAGGSQLDRRDETQPQPVASAPFEEPTSQEAERLGDPGTGSGDAWAPQATGDTTAAADDRDRIAARAYELYLARGGSGGSDMEDWLAAEREFSSGRSNDRGNDRE